MRHHKPLTNNTQLCNTWLSCVRACACFLLHEIQPFMRNLCNTIYMCNAWRCACDIIHWMYQCVRLLIWHYLGNFTHYSIRMEIMLERAKYPVIAKYTYIVRFTCKGKLTVFVLQSKCIKMPLYIHTKHTRKPINFHNTNMVCVSIYVHIAD